MTANEAFDKAFPAPINRRFFLRCWFGKDAPEPYSRGGYTTDEAFAETEETVRCIFDVYASGAMRWGDIRQEQVALYQWRCAHPDRAEDSFDMAEIEAWGTFAVPLIFPAVTPES